MQLVAQPAHQTHNLPQIVCQSVGKNSIFGKGGISQALKFVFPNGQPVVPTSLLKKLYCPH